jgi:DNA polymerase-3 subunit gamma/tau
MDIADIAKLFDVKQVEDFSADDPQNPKNAQPANKHQEG